MRQPGLYNTSGEQSNPPQSSHPSIAAMCAATMLLSSSTRLSPTRPSIMTAKRKRSNSAHVNRRSASKTVTAKLSQDELKKEAAWKAVDYVKSGMVLGLGTGSTAAFAVDRIGQLMKEGSLADIVGVPTSVRTYEQAKGGKLLGCSGEAELTVSDGKTG